MPFYDVQVDVAAVAFLNLEADSPEEAKEYARKQWRHADLQCGYVTDIRIERETSDPVSA